jgi:hypothetical protein
VRSLDPGYAGQLLGSGFIRIGLTLLRIVMSMTCDGLGDDVWEEWEEDGSGGSQSPSRVNNPNGRRGVLKCVGCRKAGRKVNSINSRNSQKQCIGTDPSRPCELCSKKGLVCGPRLNSKEGPAPVKSASKLDPINDPILAVIDNYRLRYTDAQIIQGLELGMKLLNPDPSTILRLNGLSDFVPP